MRVTRRCDSPQPGIEVDRVEPVGDGSVVVPEAVAGDAEDRQLDDEQDQCDDGGSAERQAPAFFAASRSCCACIASRIAWKIFWASASM